MSPHKAARVSLVAALVIAAVAARCGSSPGYLKLTTVRTSDSVIADNGKDAAVRKGDAEKDGPVTQSADAPPSHARVNANGLQGTTPKGAFATFEVEAVPKLNPAPPANGAEADATVMAKKPFELKDQADSLIHFSVESLIEYVSIKGPDVVHVTVKGSIVDASGAVVRGPVDASYDVQMNATDHNKADIIANGTVITVDQRTQMSKRITLTPPDTVTVRSGTTYAAQLDQVAKAAVTSADASAVVHGRARVTFK